MHRLLAAIALAALLPSCSSLPVPGRINAVHRAACDQGPTAKQVLQQSVKTHGNSWKRYRTVDVAYSGEWTAAVKAIQPELVDADFRKSSVERYSPRSNSVRQTHQGPKGSKLVIRKRPNVSASYNDAPSDKQSVLDSSALVADSYSAFLFGPSWLLDKGRDFALLENRELAGESCHLVQGLLAPGIGNSSEDFFIAWVGSKTGILHRFQFTLNGYAPTRGADVDVTYSDHWRASDGSLWPSRFVEYVQRPVRTKAHEWTMNSLDLDGRTERQLP